MKILAMPGHITDKGVTGVDYVRVIMPMKHLNGYKGIEVDILTPRKDKYSTVVTWNKRAQEYDIFYLNYNNNPKGFAAMGCMAKKWKKKIVTDLDDDLWNIKPDNTAYNIFKEGGDAIRVVTAIFNESDYLTCTSPYLKNVICHNTTKKHEQVKVFPNYIDLDLYQYRGKAKESHQITMLHYGSTSHFEDLLNDNFMEGMDKIMKEYPNVIFKTIGAFLPQYRFRWGERYTHAYGSPNLYIWVKEKFPKFMEEADFIVTPLVEDIYTRCKSGIKFVECSSAKKPGVWQDIRQYNEIVTDGKNGFLAKSPDDWYQAMKKLIEDKELRQKMGEEAYETVVADWQIKDHLDDYAQFFKKILDK